MFNYNIQNTLLQVQHLTSIPSKLIEQFMYLIEIVYRIDKSVI
jgi:hypothetical protein